MLRKLSDRPLSKPRRRCKNHIKVDIKEILCDVVNWFGLIQFLFSMWPVLITKFIIMKMYSNHFIYFIRLMLEYLHTCGNETTIFVIFCYVILKNTRSEIQSNNFQNRQCCFSFWFMLFYFVYLVYYKICWYFSLFCPHVANTRTKDLFYLFHANWELIY
jgi:hypothetical protein